MELEAGKRYKTRDGDIVECVAVWTREIHKYQATIWNPGMGFEAYSRDGRWFSFEAESPLDIVAEYKESKKFKQWVNLYANGYVDTWDTKEDADYNAEDGRVECRKIE